MVIKKFFQNLGLNRHVGTLSLARFVDAFSNSILIIVLPLYVAQLQSRWLGLPVETLVGILIFSFGIISSFAQPFSGVMSDRLDRRKIFIVIGLALMGVSTFVFILAHKFMQLILIRAVQGLGFALTIPATFSLMASYTQLENRGGAMGIYSTMRMVGFGLGPLLGGVLIVHTGFKTVFYLVGALSLFSTFLVWLLVDDPETVEKNPGQARPMPKFSDSISFEFIVLAVASVVMASAISMIVALENQFNQRLSQTAIGFGVAFSALTITRVFLQIPFGKAADIWGRKIMIIIGFVLLAPSTLLLGYVETTGQLIILRLVQGVALSGISAPIFALAADKSKEGSAGTQMSIITMAFGLGIAFGPVLAGFMAGYLSFESPFLLAGVACLLMTFFIGRYVKETVHRNNEKSAKGHWKSDGNSRMNFTDEHKSKNAESVR